jgi:tetratricopeptide (TPR) repeat protein
MAGGSYAMRWLLPATPLFAFFMALAIERLATRGRRLLAVAAGVSIVVAAVGVPRPWSSNIRSPITFLDNLAFFAQTLRPPAGAPVYWIVETTSLEKGYAYLEIGRWHMNHGYYTAAVSDLERARSLDPRRANLADYYLGICHDAAGNPMQAVLVYERLLANEPRNTGAWNNYARALQKLGLVPNARKAFEKSLEIDPDNFYTLRGIGQFHLEQDAPQQAIEYWERALEVHPNDIDLRRRLVNLLWKSGKRDRTLEHLRRLEQLTPGDKQIPRAIQQLELPDNAPSTTPLRETPERE